jgi:Fic family protein
VLYSPEFIQSIHREFYKNIPESLWVIKNVAGKIVDRVVPGEWRKAAVSVGQHQPPEAEALPDLIQSFCERYHPKLYSGDRKLTAAMAAHHRFLWIHPFADGNGRVARLLTDAMLRAAGLESYGVWCLSRGLARSAVTYKSLLARADFPRQGSGDGRGLLSEGSLLAFCDYLLDTALDQVAYIDRLLNLPQMREQISLYIQARRDRRVAPELPGFNEKEVRATARLLTAAFSQGLLARAEAFELCDMPERTASRLIARLRAEGLLSQSSSKSPLRWEIPEHAEPWYFPQLAPL